MLLVFSRNDDYYTQFLKEFCKKQEIEQLNLSVYDLVNSISISFRQNDRNDSFEIRYGDRNISSSSISCAICLFSDFDQSDFPFLNDKDAQYAARESYALWLAIYNSLGNKMVNIPSVNSFDGISLHADELNFIAHSQNIKTFNYTENNKQAPETIKILCIGKQKYAMKLDNFGISSKVALNKIPNSLQTKIEQLQSSLQLKIVELTFAVLENKSLRLLRYEKKPSLNMIQNWFNAIQLPLSDLIKCVNNE